MLIIILIVLFFINYVAKIKFQKCKSETKLLNDRGCFFTNGLLETIVFIVSISLFFAMFLFGNSTVFLRLYDREVKNLEIKKENIYKEIERANNGKQNFANINEDSLEDLAQKYPNIPRDNISEKTLEAYATELQYVKNQINFLTSKKEKHEHWQEITEPLFNPFIIFK